MLKNLCLCEFILGDDVFSFVPFHVNKGASSPNGFGHADALLLWCASFPVRLLLNNISCIYLDFILNYRSWGFEGRLVFYSWKKELMFLKRRTAAPMLKV